MDRFEEPDTYKLRVSVESIWWQQAPNALHYMEREQKKHLKGLTSTSIETGSYVPTSELFFSQ